MINAEPLVAPLMSYPYLNEFEFDGLTFIETAEASTLHGRDMNKDVLAAAMRLDEAVTLGRIEPSRYL